MSERENRPFWQYVVGAVFVRIVGWGAIVMVVIGAVSDSNHDYQPAPPASTTTTTVTHATTVLSGAGEGR